MRHHARELGLVIGGPPRSGKSTFVAALVDELQNIIRSLQSRTGWESFRLSAACASLDSRSVRAGMNPPMSWSIYRDHTSRYSRH